MTRGDSRLSQAGKRPCSAQDNPPPGESTSRACSPTTLLARATAARYPWRSRSRRPTRRGSPMGPRHDSQPVRVGDAGNPSVGTGSMGCSYPRLAAAFLACLAAGRAVSAEPPAPASVARIDFNRGSRPRVRSTGRSAWGSTPRLPQQDVRQGPPLLPRAFPHVRHRQCRRTRRPARRRVEAHRLHEQRYPYPATYNTETNIVMDVSVLMPDRPSGGHLVMDDIDCPAQRVTVAHRRQTPTR